MAAGADRRARPDPDPPEEDEPGGPVSMAGALRFLEGLVFCLLAAVVILWAVDRSRGLDFEPITVEICDGAACSTPPSDFADRAWTQYSETLDLSRMVVFSPANTCAFAVEILRMRATEEGSDLALDLMQSRGTVIITRPGDGTAIVAPGPNNDALGDVVRDAFRWQGPRGCHPMNYKPIFWPLWAVWMLLINWRLFRYRQSVWAAR